MKNFDEIKNLKLERNFFVVILFILLTIIIFVFISPFIKKNSSNVFFVYPASIYYFLELYLQPILLIFLIKLIFIQLEIKSIEKLISNQTNHEIIIKGRKKRIIRNKKILFIFFPIDIFLLIGAAIFYNPNYDSIIDDLLSFINPLLTALLYHYPRIFYYYFENFLWGFTLISFLVGILLYDVLITNWRINRFKQL